MSKLQYNIKQGCVYVTEISAEEWADKHDLKILKVKCDKCNTTRICDQPFFFKEDGGTICYGLDYDLENGKCKCGGSSTMVSSSVMWDDFFN